MRPGQSAFQLAVRKGYTWKLGTISDDGTRLFISTTDGGYPWVSIDSGVTWQKSFINVDFVAASADGTKLLVFGLGNTYQSTNSGQSWTTVASLGASGPIAMSSAGGLTLAVVGGTAFKSTNLGASWATCNGLPSGTAFAGMATAANGSKSWACQSYGDIYRSLDSGSTWTKCTTFGPNNWTAITCSSDGSKVYASRSDFGIAASSDSGATWTTRSSPDFTINNYSSIKASSDGTRLVTSSVPPLDPFDPETFNFNYRAGVYTSSDSGANWTRRLEWVKTPSGWSVFSSANGMYLMAGARGAALFKSSDYGVTWTLGIPKL